MRALPLFLAVLVGCGAEESTSGPTTIELVSPAPASTHERTTLAASGYLVAGVPVAVTIDGPPPARVEIVRAASSADGDRVLGEPDENGDLAAEIIELGPSSLVATAYDAAGAVLATSSVDIQIVDPMVEDCHKWLDLYRLQYTLGPANQGVSDPVTVTLPINGMSYRYSGNANPRAKFFMDCTLAKSLAQAAPILRGHEVTEVTDIGVYNYRCIGTGTPPNCPSGMSQHAYAKAIDIAAFTTSDNTNYSVLTDFVIDPASEKTCTAATVPGKDAFLHQVICELKAAKVWNIVLTPNYNADHRNHFHVDLTPGSDFIRIKKPDDGPIDF